MVCSDRGDFRCDCRFGACFDPLCAVVFPAQNATVGQPIERAFGVSCLECPIEPFKLARRHNMIQRPLYYIDVMQTVNDQARKEGILENVAFREAQKYA